MSTSIAIPQEARDIIKFAAQELKGMKKRIFMAKVSDSFCYGSPRLTESEFGWSRKAVELGQHEQRTGLECYGHYEVCGKRKTEVDKPQLEKDIRSLVEPECQADPQMKNTFAYTRITAKVVRQKLIEEKGWKDEELPKERSISDILNRLGYRLHRVQKTKPQKKSQRQTPFSKTFTESTKKPKTTPKCCESA